MWEEEEVVVVRLRARVERARLMLWRPPDLDLKDFEGFLRGREERVPGRER